MFLKTIFGYPCEAFMENRLTTQAEDRYLVRILQLPFPDEKTGEVRFLAYIADVKKLSHDQTDS